MWVGMKDLYRYVNGPWIDAHVIPDDRAVDGTFHELRDAAELNVRAIVEGSTSRAGTLFSSFMDTDAIDAAGVTPLEADFALLDVDYDALPKALGALDRVGVGAPVAFYVTKDAHSEDAIAYLVQSGLGLPDEAYYRAEEHAQTLRAYQEHVATMLAFLPAERLLGHSPEEAAHTVVELEKQLAAGHVDVVEARDSQKSDNPTAVADLPAVVQHILAGMRMVEHTLSNRQPSYTQHLSTLFTPENETAWRLWAAWHILRSRAGLLTEEISKANFAFYGTTMTGATQQRDRWKRGLALAEGFVGEEIGQEYVARHFPPEAKDQMVELVDYLLKAYELRISQLPWMTEATKKRALEKLSLFRAKVGYPDKWRSYEGLEFAPGGDNLVENVRRGTAFAHDHELSKIGQPYDRDEWVTTPQTVNAFYHPVVNDITFPAAILQPPFFDLQADAAQNFGAIGAVIGHEIGHGFDDQGSQYDGHGNLESWWTEEDREAFDALTAKLVDQFQGQIPSVLKGKEGISSVNGKFTLGENIGDLGGLGIAVVAYELYLKDQGLSFDTAPLATVNPDGAEAEVAGMEFTGLQRFFLSWARAWRSTIRPEMAAQYLAVDPHSPAEFRCNITTGNVDQFYTAFPSVDETSAMWVAPEDRVRIW